MQSINKGKLCIIKTVDQEIIIGSFKEEDANEVGIEDAMSIYFQDPQEQGRPPRIYLSKYNIFGNNKCTYISKCNIITLYESGETINTLYEYYIQHYHREEYTGEQIKFMTSGDSLDDELDEIDETIRTRNSSNTTIH